MLISNQTKTKRRRTAPHHQAGCLSPHTTDNDLENPGTKTQKPSSSYEQLRKHFPEGSVPRRIIDSWPARFAEIPVKYWGLTNTELNHTYFVDQLLATRSFEAMLKASASWPKDRYASLKRMARLKRRLYGDTNVDSK